MNYTKIISILTILSLAIAKPATARDSINITPQKDINTRREQRGLIDLDKVFVPKGQWIFGCTASYSTHTNSDFSLLVMEDINSMGYNFKVSPMISYSLANNITIGGRFVYSRSLLKIEDAKLSVGDSESGGVNLVVNNYYALKHSYSGVAISRQYIPLGKSRRYALFNEFQLSAGGFQSKLLNDTPVQGTYSTGYEASLGLAPGIVAFATDNIAVEINIGVMGIGFSHSKQIYNQVDEGSFNSSTLSFKVNLLSVGFGFALYL